MSIDDGPNRTFRNHYMCPICEHEWSDELTATCDDDCPRCGTRHISPFDSEEIADDGSSVID